jgi:hypothetical protein
MRRSMIRLLPAFLLSGLMIAAVEPASEAGTLVRVSFSGNGFSGWFQYDQSKPMTHPGQFVFTGSGLDHEIDYNIGGVTVYGNQGNCEPYTITTSGNSRKIFQLVATAPAGTTVTVTLPTSVTLSLTSLPFCADFPSSPLAGSTFALSGGTTYTGTITALSCTEPAALFASPQSAPPVAYFSAPPVAYFIVYPAPAPPVYVCQPGPACCLSRLFSRCSVRARCW